MPDPLPSLTTHLAHAGWSEHWLRGKRIFADLLGHTRFWQLWSRALGAPIPADADCEVLDALAVANTAADPHIPPMKLIRLLSAYGGSLAGFAGGLVYQQGAIIGTSTAGAAARDLVALREAVGKDRPPTPKAVGAVVQGWLQHRRTLSGFGVPARPRDERTVALLSYLEPLGRLDRPYWALLLAAEQAMAEVRPLPINVAGASAATSLDMGYAPEHIDTLAVAWAQHAFMGNAVEGAAQAPAILQELPAQYLEYVGPAPRKSPRAAAQDSATTPPEAPPTASEPG